MLNRKQFLKISGGTAASFFVAKAVPVFAGNKEESVFLPPNDDRLSGLLELKASPPEGTKAVRFFIDDILVAEVTNLYAVKTNTEPVWNTLTDAEWLPDGEHQLRTEVDTNEGTKTIEVKTINTANRKTINRLPLTGPWNFAEAGELPVAALDGDRPPASQPGFTGGTWKKVMVPNSLGALKEKWNKYEGIIGIYKRVFSVPSLTKNDQYSLVLESCYWSGVVFINGIKAGETKGGYLPSRYDCTKFLKSGENEIAVIVDNRFSTMGVFKRINEFYWNWGGLLQEVYLEKHPAVSFTELRAEGAASGNLQLHVTGLNATTKPQIKNISVEVYDAKNKKLAAPFQLSVTIPPGETVLKLKPLQLARPILWQLEQPYLYTVQVKGDFGLLKERTGFRDVRAVGPDIFLNGKAIQNLQGFDRHADYPGLGRTQPSGLPYKELKELRDKGFRFFRPAHYPTTRAQLDAADELGLLVIEEVNVTGLKGDVMASEEVKEFGVQQLTKMIHRDRSHPCIIGWSVGNENFTEEDGAIDYVKETIAAGRALDPARLYTQVTHRHTNDKTFAFQDFVCQNYYAGWYAKDINAIATILDAVQAYAGNKPIVLSEYGAEAIPEKEGTGKSSEFYQGFVVDAHNRLLNNRKHFFGKMYWCSTDFWCRPNWTGGSPEPAPPFHYKSLISLDRSHKKLGWKVMFSPVRLQFNPHTVKVYEPGGDIEIELDKEVLIKQAITLKEVRGQKVSGKVLIDVPKGFTAEKNEFAFVLEPDEMKSVTINLKGLLPSADKTANGFVRAVIDNDTEAQPLLFTLKATAPKS